MPDEATDAGGDAGLLIDQCGPGVCPPDPPTTGQACNNPDKCCNYSTGSGCVCGSAGWTCAAATCGCTG